jgi:hypothetical protein
LFGDVEMMVKEKEVKPLAFVEREVPMTVEAFSR